MSSYAIMIKSIDTQIFWLLIVFVDSTVYFLHGCSGITGTMCGSVRTPLVILVGCVDWFIWSIWSGWSVTKKAEWTSKTYNVCVYAASAICIDSR